MFRAFIATLLIFICPISYAHDHGQFVSSSSETKAWFNGLRADHGQGVSCCADADGTALSDVDWTTKNGHYQVKIEGEWINVPEGAVIEKPNIIGKTIVWPYPIRDVDGHQTFGIRCFLPGAMI
jgi:hypothetical protein